MLDISRELALAGRCPVFVYLLIAAELAILYTAFWYLYLREPDIIQQPEEHIQLAQMRVTAYSRFFSPSRFLKVATRDGLSGPMSGSNLRGLVLEQ